MDNLTAEPRDITITRKIITVLSVLMCLFHLFTAGVLPFVAMEQRSIHFGFALTLIFLYLALNQKKLWRRIIDYFFAAFSLATNFYMYDNWLELSMRTTRATTLDYIMGIGCIVLVLIASWKKVSGWLPGIALVFIAYCFIGPYIKGYFWFPKISFQRFLSYLYMTGEGIFGSCMDTSATTCFMYCLFGEFLLQLGAGKFLINVSYSLFGRIRGGSSKVSVVAAGLFGMVSGSATSNVAATGSLTIPMMKDDGYTAEDAGGICSSAAVGSMLMPPVMGAAAFVMAEMVGIGYGKICIAAAIPALVYYLALFIMCDLRAAKYGMKAKDSGDIPKLGQVLKEGWHYVICLLVLIFLLVVLQWSAVKAAFWSIVTMVVVNAIYLAVTHQKQTPLKTYINIFVNGAKSALTIAAACGCAGIITAVFGATTLNLRMSSILIKMAGGKLILLLLYAAIGAIVLGMGLPVLSVYLILAIIIAPAVVKMGVPVLAAHMFVFFYGNMAGITPPVGATFYVASGVAKSKPMPTGYKAFKMSVAGYLIPFVFVFNQGLFLQGSVTTILMALLSTMVGVIGLCFGLEGYLFGELKRPMRILFMLAAAATIIPETISTVIGLTVVAGLFLLCYITKKLPQKKRQQA